MSGPLRSTAVLIILTIVASFPAAAQEQPSEGRLRVFLDCQTRGCDETEFRTAIDFVDWIREPAAADVHVILTSQQTGAGREFVFDFVGRGDLGGEDLRLAQPVPETATRVEELDALNATFKAGLAAYVARRGYAGELDIRSVAPREPGEGDLGGLQEDPWNLWVFTLSANLEADGEEREDSFEWGASASASRVTHEWKTDASFDGDFNYREVELNEGQTFINRTRDWRFDVLMVRSLARHWSAGAELEANTSTLRNREIGGRSAIAIEWSLYPYPEANRRQLVVHYQAGVSRVRYEELTIFDRIEETLYDHRLAAVWNTRQPWGDAAFYARYSNYLHDWSRLRASVGSEFSVRLFRGFEVNLEANYDVIRDQLFLPAEDLTDEEILVQRRQLATGYEYWLEAGVNYRFGSIYNNVVNNRFPWTVRRFD